MIKVIVTIIVTMIVIIITIIAKLIIIMMIVIILSPALSLKGKHNEIDAKTHSILQNSKIQNSKNTFAMSSTSYTFTAIYESAFTCHGFSADIVLFLIIID